MGCAEYLSVVVLKDVLHDLEHIDAENGSNDLLREIHHREGLSEIYRGVSCDYVGHRHPPNGRYLRGQEQNPGKGLHLLIGRGLAFYECHCRNDGQYKEYHAGAYQDDGKRI